MANMAPTWVQDGAMLGSKIVPRGQKTNRVAGWGKWWWKWVGEGEQRAAEGRERTWGKVKWRWGGPY